MNNKEFLRKMAEYNQKNKLTVSEREELWDMALGLQSVDGYSDPSIILTILSSYNIENQLSEEKVTEYLFKYYRYMEMKLAKQKEVDLVSSRIVSFLKQDHSFSLSSNYIKQIHHYLFQDVYDFAGEYRQTSLISKETILNGNHICFTPPYEIESTLNYEFQQEQYFSYNHQYSEQVIEHLIYFVSSIWQIHPFREGNTRTIAIFIQQYLKYLGYNVNNVPFKENSLYFRNALVRSQYQNAKLKINYSYEGLRKFFENLLLDKNHILDSDSLKVYSEDETVKYKVKKY